MSQVKNDPNISTNLVSESSFAQGTQGLEPSLPTLEKPLLAVNKNLQLPKLASPSGKLSLENLMQAINYEASRLACKQGLGRIKSRTEQQKIINNKEANELKGRIENLGKERVIGYVKKSLHIAGLVAAVAIGGVVTFATGGSALFIIVGVIGMAASLTTGVSSVVSDFSNGRHSLSKAIMDCAEKHGYAREDAKQLAQQIEMALIATSIVCSVVQGGAMLQAAGTAGGTVMTNMADKTINIASKIPTWLGVSLEGGNALLSTGEGAMQIVDSVYSSEASSSGSRQKELQAILENLRVAISEEKDFFQAVMERSNKLLEDVSQLVNEFNKSQAAVLTAGSAIA